MPEDTVFAVASGKGGVGKTTTTVNVGTAFAGAGYEVAVVDTDLGMANLAGFVNLSPADATLHEVLAGNATLEEATYEVADGISAVPSGADLETYADIDAGELETIVDQLRVGFDFVILDVGAGVSYESVMPLGLADSVIIVATPEPAAIQDASKTVNLVERADGEVRGLTLTRVRPETDVSYGELSQRIDLPLLGKIPEDDTVRESLYSGTPIVAYDPESPASLAYRNLASTLVTGVPEPARTPQIGGDRSRPTTEPAADDRQHKTTATDGEGMTATRESAETATGPSGGNGHPDSRDDQDPYEGPAQGVTFSESPDRATNSADDSETGINLDPVTEDDDPPTTESPHDDPDEGDERGDDKEDDIDGEEPSGQSPSLGDTDSLGDSDPLDDVDSTDTELTEDAIPFQAEGTPLDEEAVDDSGDEDEDDEDDSSGGLFSRIFG
jgi:septum site-determining protein MinD